VRRKPNGTHHRARRGGSRPRRRSTLVAPRLGPPQVDQRAQPLGLGGGEVARLGEVGAQIEQRPAVGGEVVAARDQRALDRDLVADVIGRHLPARVVERAAADHLEVLRVARRGRVRVVDARQQARAVERPLCDAVDLRA
jgi:hypothetical protein